MQGWGRICPLSHGPTHLLQCVGVRKQVIGTFGTQGVLDKWWLSRMKKLGRESAGYGGYGELGS